MKFSLCLLIFIVLLINYTVTDKYSAQIIDANYTDSLELVLDFTKEYVVRYPLSHAKSPFYVKAEAVKGYPNHPVLVVVRQEKAVTSWSVPLPVDSRKGMLYFLQTSRILCHNNIFELATLPRSIVYKDGFNEKLFNKEVSVSLSTSSPIPIRLKLEVKERVDQFFITEDTKYNFLISPSEPKYFFYKFPDKSDKQIDTVLLQINSLDVAWYETCFTVSIQNSSCPVHDLDEDITYDGKYETVSWSGGMIISKFAYPYGFFIVFVAKSDNSDCTSSMITPTETLDEIRVSNITFSISVAPGLTQYAIASSIVLASILVFYTGFLIAMFLFYHRLLATTDECDRESISSVEVTSQVDRNDILTKPALMLKDLSMKCSQYYYKKSLRYLWHITSIGIFYGIPVVQLVITYQRAVNSSGNEDLCYYNFLCAHPLFGVNDFNHIFSNIGYLITGLVLLLITWYRHRDSHYLSGRGIPRHHGLFYAMGFSLIMEGILSACYHVCPNKSNFQFDTSFMYVMAVLIIVKLYQNRHPDINTSSYAVFGILGIGILLAVIGILDGNIFVWTGFILLYIIMCVYISVNIYFLSYVEEGFRGFLNYYRQSSTCLSISMIQPIRKIRFIIILLAVTANIAMACCGFACRASGIDFATFMLGLLMGNSLIYILTYIIMKVIYRERICFLAGLFLVLTILSWISSVHFFFSYSTMWTETPAESRTWNSNCSVLDFYDNHDVWHVLSSLSLFFTFMLLMTIDDDLIGVKRENIHVF